MPQPANDLCAMCGKPGAAKHLYPGPVRAWWYAPWLEEPHRNGFQTVRLHTPCVGSFVILNVDADLVMRLAPE